MADKPIAAPLPADLPENWQAGQIVAPTGEEVNLSHQHGYNYLMEMVNKAQRGVNAVNDAFESVSGKRTCRFVVGTSTAGWTQADCDFLCDGTNDDVELQAAIDALPAGGGEIAILGGTYKLSASISISGPRGDLALVGEPGSTVLEGGKISANGVDGDFMLSVQGLSISDGYLSALNTSLSVTGCRFDNSSIGCDQELDDRHCNFICVGNTFDWSPGASEQGIVLNIRRISSTISVKNRLGCVIANNVFKINSVGYSSYGSIAITSSVEDVLCVFADNVVVSSVKTKVSTSSQSGIEMKGNYLYNCSIGVKSFASIVGNRLTNGSISVDAAVMTPITETYLGAFSVSGNVIHNGQIVGYGGGSITGNAIIADQSALNPAAICIIKSASNAVANTQPAIVGNFLWGGQCGILLKNPSSSFANKSASYALVNSNRIYGTTSPIRIESEWSSCMVTDNVFETGAITDLGTNNIVRFNSDDSSTGDSSGGGTVAGVTRFNGRQGAVLPQSGDYTAAMVGAIPASQVQAVQALTQAEYDALGTKSASTLYLIKE